MRRAWHRDDRHHSRKQQCQRPPQADLSLRSVPEHHLDLPPRRENERAPVTRRVAGIAPDLRGTDRAHRLALGVGRIALLSNNPDKAEQLSRLGVAVTERVPTAVHLSPENAGYLDTLAEVLFQRGEQAEALRLIRRCVELAPTREYFRRQLKRIEAGDPKVDVVE